MPNAGLSLSAFFVRDMNSNGVLDVETDTPLINVAAYIESDGKTLHVTTNETLVGDSQGVAVLIQPVFQGGISGQVSLPGDGG